MQEDTFIKLVEAVEAEGGELLIETHYPTPHVYKIPGPSGREKAVPVDGCGCGQEALLRIPYDDLKPNKEGVEGNTPDAHDIKVCAIDDRVDLWPRFAGAAG